MPYTSPVMLLSRRCNGQCCGKACGDSDTDNAARVDIVPMSNGQMIVMQDTIFNTSECRIGMQAVESYDSKYAADGPHESQFTIPDPTSVR